jgi:hypothetical protein
MRLVSLAAVAGFVSGAAWGDTAENRTTAWGNMPAADKGEMTLSDWTSKCLHPDYVVGMTGGAPDGATAFCKDLNYSMRRNPNSAALTITVSSGFPEHPKTRDGKWLTFWSIAVSAFPSRRMTTVFGAIGFIPAT